MREIIGLKKTLTTGKIEEAEAFLKNSTIDSIPSTIQAIGGFNKKESFSMFFNKTTNSRSKRFSLYRTLFEYLYSDTMDSVLITKSHSDAQKRNRAFAAEFLAPADLLRDYIEEDIITDDEIEDIAEELNVSSLVIRHQIENHKIAEVDSPDITKDW